LTGGKFGALYPALYPGTNFQSKREPKIAEGETNKTIVNIKRISDGIPKLKIAKTAFFD
jgi:hypothetical protein